MLDALSGMAHHVIALERLCQHLQKRVDKLEDADDVFTYGESALAPSPAAEEAQSGRKRCRNRNRSRGAHSVPTAAPAAATPGPCGSPPPPLQAASVAPAAH